MANEIPHQDKVNKEDKNQTMVRKTIRFFISLAIILILGYVVFNYVPFIAKYSNHVIVTDSMVPVINVNDVVIIDNSYEIDDLDIGEIIAFNVDINNDGNDEIVVHYLYSVEEIEGEVIIKSIAHGQNSPDPWELSPDDILGKHVATIKTIGSFLRFASSTFGKIVLIFDVIIIYFIIELFSENDKKKKLKKLEDTESNDELKEDIDLNTDQLQSDSVNDNQNNID